MRLTKEQAAENRQQIVETASRLFRERGFDAVAVADLMKAAGFTHGGFYNHFPSKEALAAEACSAAVAGSNGKLSERLEHETPQQESAAWRRYADSYLSANHRDNPARGCPFAALAVDVGRQDREVQEPFAQGLNRAVDILSGHIARVDPSEADPEGRSRALRQWSEMVGALVLARAVAQAEPALSREILHASRGAIDQAESVGK